MYEIQLATARVDGAITYARTVILALIEGDTPRSRNLATATRTILDDHLPTMQRLLDQLEDAVATHHPDPDSYQPGGDTAKRADDIIELTGRYDRHLRYNINGPLKHTAESVLLTMYSVPPARAAAMKSLLAETTGRDPSDETARAYRQAAREQAEDNDLHRRAINMPHHPEDPRPSSLAAAMQKKAVSAMDEIDRLCPPEDPAPANC